MTRTTKMKSNEKEQDINEEGKRGRKKIQKAKRK